MSWQQSVNKPTAKPAAPKPKFDTQDDDWETDITYENAVTEKSQRYGSSSVAGSGRVDHVDFNSIQEKIKTADSTVKEAYQDKNPNRGYGGKYGTEQVMDKSAADFSYKADIKRHSSQTDAKKGFGGEHGIDERAKDKSAVGFDYKGIVEKHSSQTDSSKGFGGKYGVEQNAQDKSAVGFSHKETSQKHSSQTDYTAGFGGKYGVQKEATSTSSITPATPPPSPAGPKVVDKPATPTSSKADVGNIRAKFENIRKEQEAEAAKRVAEERKKRAATDQQSNLNVQANTKQQQQETIPTTKESTEKPLAARPPTPTVPEVSTLKLDENENENDNDNNENPTSTNNEENKEIIDKFVGGINVTSILRHRKTSSSSSKKDDDDDEWAVDKDETNQ